jgi:hypothetical protein
LAASKRLLPLRMTREDHPPGCRTCRQVPGAGGCAVEVGGVTCLLRDLGMDAIEGLRGESLRGARTRLRAFALLRSAQPAFPRVLCVLDGQELA